MTSWPAASGPACPRSGRGSSGASSSRGHITGFDPPTAAERAALRHELGWGDDERICLVAVGGSGVGSHLLQRVLAAEPAARRRVPGLRMVAVCGPRIDAESLDAGDVGAARLRGWPPPLARRLRHRRRAGRAHDDDGTRCSAAGRSSTSRSSATSSSGSTSRAGSRGTVQGDRWNMHLRCPRRSPRRSQRNSTGPSPTGRCRAEALLAPPPSSHRFSAVIPVLRRSARPTMWWDRHRRVRPCRRRGSRHLRAP